MAHETDRWNPSALLLLEEVMFVQDLYIRADEDADNIALLSDLASGVNVADISAQFNGVLSTFLVPAYSSIKLVIITGWPPNGALRPAVDFTTPDATHIALDTAQVSPPEAGTTGMVLYSPA